MNVGRFFRLALSGLVLSLLSVLFGHAVAHAASVYLPAQVSLLQDTIDLPGWLVSAGPAINSLLNQAFIWLGTMRGSELSGKEKQNLTFSVTVAIFAFLVLNGTIHPPAHPTDGLAITWYGYVGALFAWIYKGSNAIHDILDTVLIATGLKSPQILAVPESLKAGR